MGNMLPTEYNASKGFTGNAQWGSRLGNIPDNYMPMHQVGVPYVPLVRYNLANPDAADVDYWFDALVATAEGTFSPEASGTGNTWLQTNTCYDRPFARNFIVTPNQSTTGTVVLNFIDIQGVAQSVTVAFEASATAVATDCTGMRLVSVEITEAFDANTTLDIGFDDKFGIPYPMYSDTALNAAWNDDNVPAYPGFDATNFARGTDWAIGLADPATSGKDRYGTFNLVHADTDPDGDRNYSLYYVPTWFQSPTNAERWPTTSYDYQ